jgi:hypothetical protein
MSKALVFEELCHDPVPFARRTPRETQLPPAGMPIATWRPPLPDPLDPNFVHPAKSTAQAESAKALASGADGSRSAHCPMTTASPS